jgi:2-amino-4-hydroxy-6-hydroxymethyldihydropteridine diphosphokinase
VTVRAVVALGSNIEPRREHLERAIRALGATAGVRVVRCSPWIETRPVGGPAGQGMFLNGVAELETSLGARELLESMLAIERAAGRERKERNGPRTLDLDLLFFGDATIAEPDLIVPHPRMEERTFVLEPLAQLDPQRRLPRSGLPVREQLARLRNQGRS